MTKTNIVVQEVDILGMIRTVGKRNKRLQAIILSEAETLFGKDTPAFSKFRKLVLDQTNEFTREVVRDVFGDIEYLLR